VRSLRSPLVSLGLAVALGLTSAPGRADDTGSRWLAAVPFGVGQFQNRDVALGVFFAVSEAAAGGAAIAAYAIVEQLSRTKVARTTISLAGLNDELTRLTTANQIAFATWNVLAAAGVIEAQVSLRPARCKRDCAPVSATAAPVPGGARLGVRVAF
jgi:hypothetical protein